MVPRKGPLSSLKGMREDFLIFLYRKSGITEEGLEKRGMLIDRSYINFLLMGLVLNKNKEADYNGKQVTQDV